MKRILLALMAVLLMAGVASANWTPPIVFPEFYQVWNARNESTIVQDGFLSWASVMQFGDQSNSEIYQSTRMGKDTARVIQISKCCFLSWWGYKIKPLFYEDAYENYSKIVQTGFGFHDAYVMQVGDGNESYIEQTSLDAEAKVYQHGAFNYSDIDQHGFGFNEATVKQIGELNVSDIDQSCGVNKADVTQIGLGNHSFINQGGFCSFNTANVTQLGYLNFSYIQQSGSGFHTANVVQANFCYDAKVLACGHGGCGYGR